jgi:uncharacterized repeat protein (TIGR01451 family)
MSVLNTNVSPSSITLGTGDITYSVNLYNYGPDPGTNAILTANLPAGSTFVSATATATTCSQSLGVVTCNWASYPASASYSATITVTPGTAGANTLTSSISAVDPDPNATNNNGSGSITVNDQIDLAVFSITDSPSDITLGTGNVTYTISMYNYSTSKATNAQLTITLPASSTFVSATPTGAGGSCSGTGPVTCSWADYPSNASYSVTVVVTPGVAGTNTLSATISATQPDPDNVTAGHENSRSENTTVNSQIDLAVFSINDSPSDITLGTGNVTYTISMYNYSTSKATNAQLTITLPASSTFVSATPTGAGGSCSGTGPVTCSWADYPSNASYSVTVVVTPGVGGTNTLSASISATQPDPDNVTAGHENSRSENTTVNSQIDLAVFNISDSPDPRTLGAGNVTYTISMYNYSTSKATNAQLAITLPASSSFVSATPTGAGGSCSGTGPVTCNWADYPSNASYSVTVVVTPGVAGTNTLSASISATQPDPDNVTAGHENSRSENTTINPSSAPTITGFSPSSGPVGTVVTISGANFTGTTQVKFNGIVASFSSPNDSTVNATVPSGASSGVISVTNGIGTTNSGSSFLVTPGIAVTNTNDSGTGSLRDAIAQANSGACVSPCTIKFQIGSGLQTITPNSPFANITAANVTIDATTQPGYSGTPLIEISGVNAGSTSRGLVLAGGGATVKGLVIRNFTAASYPYGYGIYITSANNTVKSNYLGTNAAGTAASANRAGIVLDTAAATNNTIGGLTAADRNIISGNYELGISIENGPANNTVAGNYIGTDVTGSADLGNGFQGVNIAYASNNVIGGTTANARNIISGNNAQGILIYASTASGNAIQGNYIGTDATGSFAVGNGISGVSIETIASGNFVGGTSAGAGNLISGNTANGVTLDGAGTNGNFVQGNVIGLNAAGTAALANAFIGVSITNGAQNNTVGGTTANARNIISGNGRQGLALFNSNTNNNVVQGNYIGTNFSGNAGMGNTWAGIGIWGGAQSNTVGGTAVNTRNIISGNAQDGVAVRDANTSSNTIAGNYIGTDVTGSFAVANGWYGVDVFSSATNNTIGGNVAGAMNLLSGNTLGGVLFSDAGTSGNFIGSNFIGLNAAANAAISNTGPGVSIVNSATNNIVGSTSSPNKIAFNNKGVVITGTSSIGNRISSNAMAQNTTIGIDLANNGVTANDATDSDTGPNNLQNFPVINSATISAGTSLDFNLTIDSSGSSPSLGLKFELFKADTSSPEQGLTFLGTTPCLGPTYSNSAFNMTVAGVTAGNKIVATATSFTDNTCTTIKDGTSEFSAATTVVQGQAALSITKSAPASVVAGQTFNYTLQVKNVGPYAAENVSVSDTLPAGLVWNSTTAPGFSCSAPPSIVCTASSFAVTTSNITFNVTAPASPTSLNNTATITATNDSTAGDNSDSAVTTVNAASADLALTKTPNVGTVALNGSVTYTITITNNGPSPASSVVVSDPLPPGQTATTATSTQGTCTTGTNVSCNIGAMPNGANVTITIVATATQGGTWTNIVTKSAGEGDPNSANDTAAATVTVTGSNTLTVITSADSGNGSLRQALLDANSGVCSAICTINFNLSPLQQITLTSALPAITATVTIDGSTQPGYTNTPLIHLDGISCGACNGLTFNAGQSILKAVEIGDFFGKGVVVTAPATGVRFIEISTHDNSGLGIDLGNDGPTANDAGDSDTGANNLQNKPVINSAILGSGTLFLDFSVDSSSVLATNSLKVEFYKAESSGEGLQFLGYGCYFNTRSLVNQTLTFSQGSITNGTPIVATATSFAGTNCTSPSDGTSEFSNSVIAVNCTPPPATITAPSGVCPFSTGNNASAPATAGATYAWSITNGTITGGLGTNAITFDAGSSGAVTLNVTVTSNGCSSNGSQNVTIRPASTATSTGSATICAGGSTTISAALTGTAPFNVTWSDGFTQVVSSGTTASRSVSPASSTNYSVTTISDAFCNGSGSGNTLVAVNPVPTATVSGSATICAGNSATIGASLTGTAPWNITWSDGFTEVVSSGTTSTRSVNPSSTTTYTITALSDASCTGTSSGSATVTVNPLPAPNITGPTATCSGTPVTLDAGVFASYLWNTGATTQTITVSPSSTTIYSVAVTNGAGCSGSDSHTVTVSGAPDATITAPAAVCSSSTGNNASVPPGASSYVWTISGGTITSGQNTRAITFSANASGSVVLGVTTTTGACTANGSSTIPITPPPVATITGPTTVCANTTFTLDAGSHATYQWNNGTTTRFLVTTQSVASATYSVIVTDGASCSATDTHTVTTTPSPDATVTAPSQVDPSSSNNAASVPNAGAGATYNWTINNGTITAGAGTNSILFSAGASGTVDLDVTVTFSGCSSNGNASVSIGTPQQADLAVTKSAPSSVQAGASFAYTIVVTNNGPFPAVGQLVDGLPNGITINSIDAGSWNCSNANGQINCSGSLNNGTSNTITLNATAPQQAGTITNNVVVTSPLFDPNPSNNSAFVTTNVLARITCPTTPPTLLAPANGAALTNASVTFQWNGVPNAAGYDVYLAAGANGTPVIIGSTNATTTSLTHSVPPGDLTWSVVANIDGCPPRSSQTATFNVKPPAQCANSQRPIAIAPLDGSTATSPVDFDWTSPAGATRFELYVVRGNGAPTLAGSTTNSALADVNLAPGSVRWFVRAFFAQNCSPLDSDEQRLEIVPVPPACSPLGSPVISAPGEISSGVPFLLQWGEIAGATGYQLQIDNAEPIATAATSYSLTRTNNGTTPIGVFARVRAVDARCTPTPTVSAYGPTAAIFVLPQQQLTTGSVPLSDPTPVHYSINLGAEFAGQTFTATPTESWLSVSPNSGVVAPAGTTLDVTANPELLGVGTHSGAIRVLLNSASSRIVSNATTSISPSININLVTPVATTPANTPSPDTMIIPAVANADGINAHFQSDVRVANTSPQLIKYQLTFIPSGDSGFTKGAQTTFSIEPGRTIALDDILRSFFGTGTSNAMGVLQIKPLTTTSSSTSSIAFGPLANLVSFASSRTFNLTPNGTFGQYVPAVPYANFADKSTVLSLQQIAQNAKTRSNLGLVEGSGNPADLLIRVFGGNGQQITSFTQHLNGGQHTQLNSFLFERGITLEDGRVEVQVTSSSGKVTAYASVLDNETSDAVLVSPVAIGETGNTKWVLPGVADIRSGFADWQSDVRVFNAGTAPANVIASFYSQGGGEPKVQTLTLAPGEVKQLDKILPSFFGVTNDGGALQLSTATASRIIATARTYNQTTKGTYGQFVNAVTPQQAVAVGTRPLQLLQIEESPRMRSNVGFAEVTGKPVKLEVTVTPPDAKFAAVIEVDLAANEYRQMNSLLSGLGLGDTYNARISVRAVSGQGRATTFASVIDLQTNDPTYVEAQ